MTKLNFYEVAKRYEVGVTTLYAWLGKGWMPKPSRLGGRVFWPVEVLDQWDAAGNPRPCDKEQIECKSQQQSS